MSRRVNPYGDYEVRITMNMGEKMSNQNEIDLLEKYFTEGGGGKSAAFLVKGTLLKGVLMEPPTEQVQKDLEGNEKTFEDGKVRKQLVLKLQTEERDPEDESDLGIRWLYTKHQMVLAFREALKASGEKVPRVGGTLEMAWTGEIPPSRKGYNPTKTFSARWTPPPISLLEEKKSTFDFDSAPVAKNSAESPLDSLRGMQGRGNAGLPANLQDEQPPF